ncbi:MAG: tryptophan--tRNA ligase [Parcubacteria group bacterium]
MNPQIVLSGIRATGKLHMGNYLGAIQHFVKLANDPTKKCLYFIANLHTLTTWTPPEDLKNHLAGIVQDFLACGIDPQKAVIYAQSSVPEISELNWLLACLTNIEELKGMAHFKDKEKQMKERGEMVSAGLLIYPVLMAADILGPRANLVPVGQDQHPHVEFARDIARRFNRTYDKLFPIPELLEGPGIRVPGLGASGKMGKSESENNVLNLDDSSDAVNAKFKIAVTDEKRQFRKDPGDPSKCNIFILHQMLSEPGELSWAQNGCQTAGIGCLECKMVVAAHVNKIIEPIRQKRSEICGLGASYVLDILADGGKKARQRFSETVQIVKDKMGVPSY